MISLEQVRLLESRVSKTIEYVRKVTEEKDLLREKLDSYQKRIDELEVLVKQFKEEQSRIEDGILSALDRLNQFEDAVESALSREDTLSPEGKLPDAPAAPNADENAGEAKKSPESKTAGTKPAEDKNSAKDKVVPEPKTASGREEKSVLPDKPSADDKSAEEGELDIF